jgi:hypothetical protein
MTAGAGHAAWPGTAIETRTIVGFDAHLLPIAQQLVSCFCKSIESLAQIAKDMDSLARDVRILREKYVGVESSEVTGIVVTQEKEVSMTQPKIMCLKKSGLATPRVSAAGAKPLLGNVFAIVDGGQGTFDVMGLDSETPPVPVDISSLANLTVVSADPKVTVDPIDPTKPMTAILRAAAGGGTGAADVKFTATAKDGSFTFSFDAHVAYSGGAITGITVTQSA